MAKQDYSNHTKYYTPHHFIFYPVTIALMIAGVYFGGKQPDHKTEWYMISAVVFVVAWLSFMLRQHYALTLQNRIVRLEMRLRYFQLSGKRFEPLEAKLKFGQLAALRFASDDELPALIDKTLKEDLAPGSIKKLITHWQPDHMRV